jgi:hypothetical protein
MSIQAIECVALTKLTTNVEVNSVDHGGITISGDHVTHTLFHGSLLLSFVSSIKIPICFEAGHQASKSFCCFCNFIFILGAVRD